MKPPYLLPLLLLFLFSLLPPSTSDLSSDRSSLLLLRSSLRGRLLLLWNPSSPSPCLWTGVTCSSNSSSVTALRLPGMGLSGSVPQDAFQNLTELQTLSLRFNALSGPLPSSLPSSLRNLYLHQNNLSGPIPSSLLLSVPSLVRLNLAYNNLSGPIPPTAFNNLSRLATLLLNNNHLSGPIPNLDLPSLAQFNVSFNNLTGAVPGNLTGQPASAFLGNALCGGPLLSCTNNGTTTSGSKGLSGGAIAGIVIGCVVGLLLILAVLFFVCCRRKNVDEKSGPEGVKQREVGGISGEKSGEDTTESMSAVGLQGKAAGGGGLGGKSGGGNGKSLVFFGKGEREREFDLEDLLRASAEVLGKGTFGTAYKAVLETGLVVAVKRLKEVAVPEKEFREKVEVVGRMDHENLVPLRAYYYSRDEKLLVYDYLPMGSLSALLHGNRSGRTPLNWETRSTIALGASQGIAYLHSQGPSISHGNIKSSNILLTKSYEPRVSDFGLAQLVGPNTSTPNRVAGYRAPEVTDARKVSQKSDVYSFGVLLLELMTGKAPTHALLNEEGVDLPRWVQSVVREEWTVEVFDPELLRYQSFEEEMVQLLQLGIDCVAQFPDSRPSMTEVHTRIEEICQSTLQRNQDTLDDIVNDGDEPQQQDVAVGSSAPHSSVVD